MSWRWLFFVDGIAALTGIFLTLRYIPNFEGTPTKIDYLCVLLFSCVFINILTAGKSVIQLWI